MARVPSSKGSLNFRHADVLKLDIPSAPDPKPPISEVETQTQPMKVHNVAIQASKLKDADAQTSPYEFLKPLKKSDEELLPFIKAVGPRMLVELALASRQGADVFEKYEPMWDEINEDIFLSYELLLRPKNQAGSPTRFMGAKRAELANAAVAALSWNAGGSTIAAAYGLPDMLGWCDTVMPVCVWNIFRRRRHGQDPSEGLLPDLTVEVNGFATCLAFHPEKPAVLAGGTYSGEVCLWDVSNETEPLVCASAIEEVLHKEAVTAVRWVTADLAPGSSKDDFRLASLSGSGRVLLWDCVGTKLGGSNSANELNFPVKGFSFKLSKKQSVFGGLSLAFSPKDPTLFAAGSEVGVLLRGHRPPLPPRLVKPDPAKILQKQPPEGLVWKLPALAILDNIGAGPGAASLQKAKGEIQAHVEKFCALNAIKEVTPPVFIRSAPPTDALYPPAKTAELEPHGGPVTTLSFSPFHRKLLLSGGADGAVKVFDVLQARPLFCLFPPVPSLGDAAISAAAFSTARPLVFACAAKGGGAFLFDLMQSKHQPVAALPVGNPRETGGVSCLAFNPVGKFGLLGVGTGRGRILIFRLPHKLTGSRNGESREVARLLKDSGAVVTSSGGNAGGKR